MRAPPRNGGLVDAQTRTTHVRSHYAIARFRQKPPIGVTQAMTDESEADRPGLSRLRLSKAERDALDARIAARVREAGFDPVRPRDPDDGAPLPKNRWIFPSVAYSRGGAYAKSFKAAMKGVQTDNFRLVTLRFGSAKPAPGELEDHIRRVSEAANNVIRYLVRLGIAQPQLSVIHLRLDEVSGRLDPHLQGAWEIRPDQMSRVTELLRRQFSGVWIDEEPIRDLGSVAFYLCAGIIDHGKVPDWPLTAIGEIWSLPGRLHFVRPAGAFAAWIKAHRVTSSTKKPPKSPVDAPRIAETAPPAPQSLTAIPMLWPASPALLRRFLPRPLREALCPALLPLQQALPLRRIAVVTVTRQPRHRSIGRRASMKFSPC